MLKPKIPTYSTLLVGLLSLSACQAPPSPGDNAEANPSVTLRQPIETPASRVLAEPSWVGYLKISSRSSGTWTTVSTANRQWKSSYRYAAPVEVTMFSASNFALVDLKPGASTFSVVDDSTFQGISILRQVARCSKSTPAGFAFMSFSTDNSYSFQPTPFSGTSCPGTATQPEGTTPVNVGWYAYNSYNYDSLFNFTLPALDEPLRLHATRHLITVDGVVVESIPNPLPYGSMAVEWDFEWDLRPEDTDVDLVLSAEAHDTWLPKATLGSVGTSLTPSSQIEPGSNLVVKATAIPKGTSPVEMKYVRFILTSSSIPGTSMNLPSNEASGFEEPPSDLTFEQDRNAGHGLNFINSREVETPTGSFTEATAEVSSFDFGGFGELIAVGLTVKDRMVYSRVKDPSSTPGVPLPPVKGPFLLPKRTAPSLIADSWKAGENSLLKADNDDTDALPASMENHHLGDALSLYEEYRGFVINGVHVRTKPSEVDFFVSDELNTAAATQGIALFENATHLKVHSLGALDFSPGSRVINANHEGGVHNGDKYFVIMKFMPNRHGVSKAIGGPNTPRLIQYIAIADDTRPALMSYVVSHELGHSANLPHHGENGFVRARWEFDGPYLATETPLDPSGLGAGHVKIIPLSFAPSHTPLTSPSQEMFIGGRCFENNVGGVFSGAHDCIMRDVAQAFIPITSDHRDERHTVTESPGTTLCKDRAGTGFNGTSPSRYGDAAAGRGECSQKVCVNDNHNHAGYGPAPECTLIRNTF